MAKGDTLLDVTDLGHGHRLGLFCREDTNGRQGTAHPELRGVTAFANTSGVRPQTWRPGTWPEGATKGRPTAAG
jgi:hypothetical protein